MKCEVWPVGCRSASKCDREPLEGCAPRGRVASRSVVLGPLCRVPGMCIEWVSALAALAGICGDYCTLLVHWTHVLSASVVRGLCLSRVGHRRDQCTGHAHRRTEAHVELHGRQIQHSCRDNIHSYPRAAVAPCVRARHSSRTGARAPPLCASCKIPLPIWRLPVSGACSSL